MMYLIDTNILVNYFFGDLLNLTTSERELVNTVKDLEPRERWVTDFVLAEFSLVIQKVLPKRYGFADKKSIVDMYYQRITTSFANFFAVFTMYIPDFVEVENAVVGYSDYWRLHKGEKALSFVDLFLILIAQKNSIGLLTADKKMLSYMKAS